MTLNSQSSRIAALLAQRAAQGADATEIADAVIAAWVAVDTALSPIIGQPSVAVLYMRSRHVTGRAFPWLRPRHAQVVMDLPALRTILMQQDAATAAAGGGLLLQTFYELLASLVGVSLTGRLLDAVWTPTSSGPPAQDTSP